MTAQPSREARVAEPLVAAREALQLSEQETTHDSFALQRKIQGLQLAVRALLQWCEQQEVRS